MSSKIIGGVLGSGLFGIAGKAAKGIIGGHKKDEPMPSPAPSPVMPTTDDEAVRRARKRAIAAQLQRSGRSSTILSAAYDSSGTTLGG